MDISIEKEIKQVKVIDDKKQYWFIRTFGGSLFDDYLENGYVGFGFNNIPQKFIVDRDKKRLVNSIENSTNYKSGSATKWANQLLAFQHEIKIGDTIIMPDENSNNFAFGTIESDIYLVNDIRTFYHKNETHVFPEKRRRVNWDNSITKINVQSDLKSITNSHAGLSNINSYGSTIEGYLSSIFIYEEYVYLVIKINQDEDINAFALNNFLTTLTYFYKEFCEE